MLFLFRVMLSAMLGVILGGNLHTDASPTKPVITWCYGIIGLLDFEFLRQGCFFISNLGKEIFLKFLKKLVELSRDILASFFCYSFSFISNCEANAVICTRSFDFRY